MLKFLQEIKKILKIPEIDGEFSVLNINGKALYAEGQKGLLFLSEEKVMFKVNKKIIVVHGKNLKIKELTKETISLTGEIEKTEVVWWKYLKKLEKTKKKQTKQAKNARFFFI